MVPVLGFTCGSSSNRLTRSPSWAGVVSGRSSSDWYHLKLWGTSATPMIVHVRFISSSQGPQLHRSRRWREVFTIAGLAVLFRYFGSNGRALQHRQEGRFVAHRARPRIGLYSLVSAPHYTQAGIEVAGSNSSNTVHSAASFEGDCSWQPLQAGGLILPHTSAYAPLRST